MVAICLLLLGWGLPRWHSGKEPTCQCRRHQRRGFDPRVGKLPWRRKWQSTPVFLPGKSHGQRSLVGYSSRVAELSTHWGWGLSYRLSDSFAQIYCHFCWLWTKWGSETFSRKKMFPQSFTAYWFHCHPSTLPACLELPGPASWSLRGMNVFFLFNSQVFFKSASVLPLGSRWVIIYKKGLMDHCLCHCIGSKP